MPLGGTSMVILTFKYGFRMQQLILGTVLHICVPLPFPSLDESLRVHVCVCMCGELVTAARARHSLASL